MGYLKVRNQTKNYDGDRFKLDGVFDNMRQANIAKRGYKQGGHKARIQKVSNGYAVWYRNK